MSKKLIMDPRFFIISLIVVGLILNSFSFFVYAPGNENVNPFIYNVIPNSFGNNVIKEVNWSFIEENTQYILKRDGIDVIDTLFVNFSSVFTNRKYSYDFTAFEKGYFEFTLIFDSKALSSYIDNNNHTVFFNYTDGQLMYNFSDIWSIVGQFDSNFNLVDNVFTMKLGRQCNKNVHVVLDPWFGYQSGSSSYSISLDRIVVGKFQYTGDTGCTVDNVSFYVGGSSMYEHAIGVLYDSSENLIEYGDEVTLVSSGWYTSIFDGTTSLTNNAYYYIGFALDRTTTTYAYYDSSGGLGIYQDQDVYNPPPLDPAGFNSVDSDGIMATYCSYTCGGEPCVNDTTILPVSTVNNSINVDDCNILNWTALVNSSCCDTIDFVNISCNGLYHNVTSGSNGTYWLNISYMDCGTEYTVYVNASLCDDTVNESIFYFTTEDCCIVTNESFKFDDFYFNQTINCKDYNDTFLNVSFYVNSSCDNTIDLVNITLSNGNTSEWTSENEGLFYVNWTGLTLSCNTNYTLWVNISDGDGCNNDTVNNTYYFLTCPCYTPACCSFNLESEYPVNKSSCFSNSSYIIFSVWLNTSCDDYNFSYVNISFGSNYSNYSDVSEGHIFAFFNLSSNLSCGYNYSWSIVFNKDTVNCSRQVYSFWFTTCSCGGMSCDECWALFLVYLNSSGYIKESDNIQIEPTNSFLSIILTLVFFVIFFIYGYTVNKRSAGAFLMFSGFIFLSLEFLIASYLQSIVIAFFGAFGIFIIILGVRKWLFMPENEKTRSEGQ